MFFGLWTRTRNENPEMKKVVQDELVREMTAMRALGVSNRAIAARLGVSRSTVREHLEPTAPPAARERKASSPPAAGWYEQGPASGELGLVTWAAVCIGLRRQAGVTRRQLWLEAGGLRATGMTYSEFCRGFRKWQGAGHPVTRLVDRAGEVGYVALLPGGVRTVGRDGQIAARDPLFLAMLGASGLVFAAPCRSQGLPEWLLLHRRAFSYFEGVPRFVVPGFGEPSGPGINRPPGTIAPEYLALAREYATTISPLMAFRTAAQVAAAASVAVIARWEFAPPGDTSDSFTNLEQAVSEKVQELNRETIPGLARSREDLFLQIERPSLGPLPAGFQ